MSDASITGIMIYYYFVCKRKLWFFHNDIAMEEENELVQMGKNIDTLTYSKERKHIMIHNEINIDFIEKKRIIHEIKKSRKIEEASIWQVKYYLYYLKKLGAEGIGAKIDYPLLKQVLEVELSDEDEKELERIIVELEVIIGSSKMPEIVSSKICKKCAYYDLCMI